MTNIYYGQNAELSLISQSHGRFSLGYCESFEVEPQHTQKKLFFFNKKEGLPISILEGGAGRFGYLESEEMFILGTLLDKNVRNMDVINDEPAAYQEFQIILNAKNNMGVLDMGVLVKRCRAAGNPAAMTPRDEQHGTFGFQAATRYLVKGAGIGYARITHATPAGSVTVTDDDIQFATSYVDAAGTGTITSSGTTVTGDGTSFLSELAPGGTILVGTERKVIVSIASDTSLVIDSAFASDILVDTAFQYSTSATIEATTPQVPVLINIEDALTTRLYFYVLKNGTEIKTGFTLDAMGKFSVPMLADTDVYEVFYAFKPV